MTVLFPHQCEGLTWMKDMESRPRVHRSQPRGGILAHDMGMGKTVIVLSLIDQSSPCCTLVVCPKSVLSHWQSEILKHTSLGAEHITVHHGRDRDPQLQLSPPHILLTTFDIVRLEYGSACSILFQKLWGRVIVDEAHRICEQGSKTSKAMTSLRSYNRWCVTGTPYKNNLSDLTSLCKFIQVDPYCNASWWRENAHSQHSLQQWRRTYLHVRKKGGRLPIQCCTQEVGVPMAQSDREWSNKLKRLSVEGCRKQELELTKILRLRQVAIHPLVLVPPRVLKHLLLPSRDTPQAAPACASCGSVDGDLSEPAAGTDCRLHVTPNLSFLLSCPKHRLCDQCRTNVPVCGPCVMEEYSVSRPSAQGSVWAHSGKSEALLRILQRHIKLGEKCVVFSEWTTCLDVMQHMLDHFGIRFHRFDGSINAVDERASTVSRFAADPSSSVLLTSLGAGGVGINLTCASVVVMLEPYWNDAIEQQAIDRVHRLGQTQPVSVYKLTLEGSIEEWVKTLKQYKSSEYSFYVEGEKVEQPLPWKDEDLMRRYLKMSTKKRDTPWKTCAKPLKRLKTLCDFVEVK